MSRWKKLCLLILVAAFLAGLASAALSQRSPQRSSTAPARMLKCTDAKGKIYYSDRPGPECGDDNVQELNRHGVVVNRPATTAPAAASNAPKNETAKQKQERTENERRDKALLMTYTSEQQIEDSKQRSLEIPVVAVKQTEGKLAKAQASFDDLRRQRAQYTDANKPVPPKLDEDLRRREHEISVLNESLAERKELVNEISKRFDGDKARFRELKAASAR